MKSPGPTTSEAYSQISGNTVFPQIGKKKSYLPNYSIIISKINKDNSQKNLANVDKTMTRDMSKSSLVSV